MHSLPTQRKDKLTSDLGECEAGHVTKPSSGRDRELELDHDVFRTWK
jgi:hypothetical protein